MALRWNGGNEGHHKDGVRDGGYRLANGIDRVLTLNILFVALSILGNEFVCRRDRRGWWVWLLADVLAAVFFLIEREWWTVLLYVYFCWAFVRALGEWRRQERVASR